MTDEADEDVERQLRESFGRMRTRTADESATATALDGKDETPPGEPSVPAKLFIGPNATWYDDRWRWMDWRGKRRSWNGAAAFTFGAWFAYRRMHRWLALYLAWMTLVLFALLSGLPAVIPLGLHAVVMLLAGVYGNALYLAHFRRIARKVAQEHDGHEEQLAAVAAAGGVAPRIAYAVPVALIALTAGIGYILHVSGGGPTINV